MIIRSQDKGSIHGALNLPKCFQMPSDEEVEV